MGLVALDHAVVDVALPQRDRIRRGDAGALREQAGNGRGGDVAAVGVQRIGAGDIGLEFDASGQAERRAGDRADTGRADDAGRLAGGAGTIEDGRIDGDGELGGKVAHDEAVGIRGGLEQQLAGDFGVGAEVLRAKLQQADGLLAFGDRRRFRGQPVAGGASGLLGDVGIADQAGQAADAEFVGQRAGAQQFDEVLRAQVGGDHVAAVGGGGDQHVALLYFQRDKETATGAAAFDADRANLVGDGLGGFALQAGVRPVVIDHRLDGLDHGKALGFFLGHTDFRREFLALLRDVLEQRGGEVLDRLAAADGGVGQRLGAFEVLELVAEGGDVIDALLRLFGERALDGGDVDRRGDYFGHGAFLLNGFVNRCGFGCQAPAEADGGVGRHGDERVFEDFPVRDAVGCRLVAGSFKRPGGGIQRAPEGGQVARGRSVTARQHPFEQLAVQGSFDLLAGLADGLLDDLVDFVTGGGLGQMTALHQLDGLAVVGGPADGHLAAHLVVFGANRARQMMAAQVIPVVVEKQRSAVVDPVEAHRFRRAFEDLDAPPALVGVVAGEGQFDGQILAVLDGRLVVLETQIAGQTHGQTSMVCFLPGGRDTFKAWGVAQRKTARRRFVIIAKRGCGQASMTRSTSASTQRSPSASSTWQRSL